MVAGQPGVVRRCGVVAVSTLVAATALVAGSSAARASEAADAQLDHGSALYQVGGPDHAAAQEFSTDSSHLSALSAFVVSKAGSGTITVSVRTAVDDPGSAVASGGVDIAALGGSGSGWLRVPVDADVTAGHLYYLVVQATGTDDTVVWNGTKSGSAPPSWNYDRQYWGGWHRETGNHLAFGVNLSGADACAASNTCYRAIPPGDLAVNTAGLLGNADHVVGLTPLEAAGARYVPGSNVLRLPDGRWRYVPTGASTPVTVASGQPRARAQIRRSRAWLVAGQVPGHTRRQRQMSARALLDLRLLTQRNGAVAAAWYGIWAYSWPRDASFAAVALARTGHPTEAYRILRFNAGTQRADGTWEARTTLDGEGPPDDRQWQLDANGWVPWAVWQYTQAAPGGPAKRLYPTVRRALNHVASGLGADGLPPASPDYWEVDTDAPNLGTAAPLLAGLRAGTDLARQYGHRADAHCWQRAARRLAAAIGRTFGRNGYQRTVTQGSGLDSAIAFMAPPFNIAPAGLGRDLRHSFDVLRRPNGGVVPGQSWAHEATWTPETMFFALAWSGHGRTGDHRRAGQLVNWLAGHRTVLGAIPEQITEQGDPASVAPLAWTDSLALLTMTQLDGYRIPVPHAG